MNCVIVHGCPSNKEKAMSPETRTYDKHWIPWTKRKLEEAGMKTETPLMPDPWEPEYDKFKTEFEKCDINENTVLVGHSCASAFLVRWLGEDGDKKVKKLILVAPWKIPQKERVGADVNFYSYEINDKVKDRVREMVIFTADDEEDPGKESAEIFHKALGGKVIELKRRGHYTLGDMGTEEFPELIEEVLN